MNHNEYKKYLRHKRVALVGPAASIEGSKNGSKIDENDIVIRINYAKIKDTKDSGTKTDVIYYDGSYHDYSKYDLKFLVCAYPETEWFFDERCSPVVHHYQHRYKHKIMSSKIYNEIKTELDPNKKVRPNTGLIAMVDLLGSELKSLYITGIDFYKTGYLTTHPSYGDKHLSDIKKEFKKGDNGDYHDSDRQFNFFLDKIIGVDERVLLDDFLSKIITKDKA